MENNEEEKPIKTVSLSYLKKRDSEHRKKKGVKRLEDISYLYKLQCVMNVIIEEIDKARNNN